MQLPDSLKEATTHFDIKLKAGVGYFRYQFVPFELKNNRKGWSTSSITRHPNSLFNALFFSRKEETTIKEKSSFLLVQSEKDTAFVNVAVNTTLRYTDYSHHLIKLFQEEKELEGSTANYVAIIETSLDSNGWMLSTFVSEKQIDSWVYSKDFKGWLTNGTRRIDIEPVFIYEDGKEHITAEMLGCVFKENKKPIAAIQFLGPVLISLQKQNHIWLPQQDDALKMVLAAASTALMARVHQMRP